LLIRRARPNCARRFFCIKRGHTLTTLVIDRQTLPESILSFIGAARIRVQGKAGKVVLTPEAEIDGPDPNYIDPADYPDTTAYLNALPGVAERLIKSMNAPASEFTPAPPESFRV